MKKFFMTFILTAIVTFSFNGCSEQEEYGVEVTTNVQSSDVETQTTVTTSQDSDVQSSDVETQTAVTTSQDSDVQSSDVETQTTVTTSQDSDVQSSDVENQTTTSQTDNIQFSDGIFVYDNANVLSETDFAECNDYAEWINENFMLNTAVVTTDDIQSLSPSVYAEQCYNDIFSGKGSGIILLINNDTNKDYIYKHGTAKLYIPEKDEKEIFFYATQDIVNGDFKSAILKFLSLAELCPEYVFDNGEMFVQSQIETIETTLEENKDNVNVCIMTTSNITEQTNSELAMTFYTRHFPENKGNMLFIDKQTGESLIISDGKETSADDENLQKINSLTVLKDYYGAVTEYFNVIGILTENTQATETLST